MKLLPNPSSLPQNDRYEIIQPEIVSSQELSQNAIREGQKRDIQRLRQLAQRTYMEASNALTLAENYNPDTSDRIDLMAAIKLKGEAITLTHQTIESYKKVHVMEFETYELAKPDTNVLTDKSEKDMDEIRQLDQRLKSLAEEKSRFSDLDKTVFEALPLMTEETK